MIVKRFGCTTIHNKALYKCIIHSFIQKNEKEKGKGKKERKTVLFCRSLLKTPFGVDSLRVYKTNIDYIYNTFMELLSFFCSQQNNKNLLCVLQTIKRK